MKTRILITGANGQLGTCLQDLFHAYPDFEFKACDRATLDITNHENVKEVLSSFQPHYIINTAAYTAVDKAETEIDIAKSINTIGPEIIATEAAKIDACMVHISSDYVYHSIDDKPIPESAPTLPQGIYAKTKYEGDVAVQGVCQQHYIIRTSWVYAAHSHNFVNTMLRLAESKKELTIVADQIGAPSYAPDIAQAILQIISSDFGGNHAYGIYNFANSNSTNWAEFARTIFELSGHQVQVNNTTTEAYGAPSPRPLWSVLDLTKITNTFDIHPRHWKDALKACLAEKEK